MRTITVALASAMAGMLGPPAPVPPAAPSPAPSRVVTVTARDHAFEAPDTIASGVVTFRLNDLGPTQHHLIVFRLDDSVTMRRFYDAMRGGIATPPGIAALGGPESKEDVTLVLRPGRYVLGCLRDFDDGATHLSRGMMRALTVVPGSAEQRAEAAPTADVTVTMRAYDFSFSGPLRPGRRVLRLENAGPQEHHILLQRLAPGKTKADVEQWMARGRTGARPLSPVFFGTTRQSPGETAYVTVDLEAGGYLFICRIPDAKDGRPHVDHGMRTEVRVEEPVQPPALPGRVVDVEAGEFFFRAPDSIPAGLTTFRLRQVGLVDRRVRAGGAALDSLALDAGDLTRGFHMLWLVRLDEGRSLADYYRAADAGEPHPWARDLGGPGFAMPPGSSNATLALEPGSYLLVCHVGSLQVDRGRRHLRHGMLRALTVVPSSAAAAAMPEADVVVRVAADGTLGFSAPLVAGRRVVRVENAGARPYEFLVRRVLPGHTVAEAIAWRRPRAPAMPAPFEVLGGLADVPAGRTLTTTMTFEAGEHFVGGATRVPFTVRPAR